MMARLNFLNVSLDNLTLVELLENLGQGGTVYTPNVSHLLRLQWDQDFYQIYQQTDFSICDSQIIWFISQIRRTPIREKISGSDLFPAFYHYYRDDENVKIFLLGAAEGVGEQAQQRINGKVGRNIVVDSYSPPYGFELDAAEGDRIIARINASGATTLVVGLGAPKQEKWIHANRHRLPHVKVFMAIGAAIDFEAGHISRAPKWISHAGLEWAYRIGTEPKRLWKRYFNDAMPFIRLLCSDLFGLYRNPFADQNISQESRVFIARQSS